MEKITGILEKNSIWDLYNSFFLSADIDRIRKFMVREYLFKLSLEIPGDIVELGVFKGTGIAQLIKLRDILIPGTSKKIIGFDLFSQSSHYKEKLDGHHQNLEKYYSQCNINMEKGISKDSLSSLLDLIPSHNKNIELVEGDISQTLKIYLEKNPGFRISYLYFDMDIDEPTYIALVLLYERIVRGGIIVFDEYSCSKWTESDAVDRFMSKYPDIKLRTLSWAKTPTAYIIKN